MHEGLRALANAMNPENTITNIINFAMNAKRSVINDALKVYRILMQRAFKFVNEKLKKGSTFNSPNANIQLAYNLHFGLHHNIYQSQSF